MRWSQKGPFGWSTLNTTLGMTYVGYDDSIKVFVWPYHGHLALPPPHAFMATQSARQLSHLATNCDE